MKKNVVIGILAHVDAGKTTLSEAMLYLSGKIKKLGRVDHHDSYLDTHSIERSRGITIFSKQAVIDLPQSSVTLLDTPGHVDFVSETERSLRVLDYAVLVISGTDGVQAHTETLWQLLRRYGIPTFIFVTKMDLPVCDRAALMADLQRRLDAECVDFGENAAALNERLAMCGEAAMDEYLSCGELSRDMVAELIKTRRVFPCFFGSGLRTEGVEEFMQAIDEYAIPAAAGDGFSARVYKIARDAQGKRLSFLRVNGGELSVRQLIRYAGEDGAEHEEKISQLRIYSGIKYEAVDTVKPGRICAALGLSETFPGQGLGAVLGMGVGREWVGDIRVMGDTAYIFCLPSVHRHLLSIDKVGRCGVTAENIAPEDVPQAKREVKEKSFSVMSMRLDAVTAGMFDLSRTEAAKEIRLGNVSLNYEPTEKPDAQISAGDIISLRGAGKGSVTGTGGTSRKGRLFVYAEILK